LVRLVSSPAKPTLQIVVTGITSSDSRRTGPDDQR
jgi:hypothetical protein